VAIGAVAINIAPPAATNNGAKAFRSIDMAILKDRRFFQCPPEAAAMTVCADLPAA
jgi:hypothetical protein